MSGAPSCVSTVSLMSFNQALLFNKSLVWICSPDRVNSSMRDCHVFLPCARDAIMPDCLDKAHWDSWALRIPMNFNHTFLGKNFSNFPSSQALVLWSQWAKNFLDRLTSLLLFLFIFFLWDTPGLLNKMLWWGLFFCSYACRSGFDIWLERTEILHGGVWKAPRRAFFCLPEANTK